MAVFKRGKAKGGIVDTPTAIEPKPVYAVMAASSTLNPDNKLMSKAIERAMGNAVVEGLRSGLDIVNDTKTIRERMMVARVFIKDAWPKMDLAARKKAAGVE